MAGRKGNSVERYYASKKKRHKARKVRLYLTLSLVCIATFIVLSLTVFFNIASFRVQGNKSYTAQQIITGTGLAEGDNLFRLNKFKIAAQMKEQFPYIGEIEIYRKLPTTLCIDITETKAAMVVYQGGQYILLDETQKVLEKREKLPEGVIYLVGAKLSDATTGKTAVFEKSTHADIVSEIITQAKQDLTENKISAIDLTEQYNLRLYYDNHRIKILLGNRDKLSDKLQLADMAISQNGIYEKARIDVTGADAAYYRVLQEDEIDDLPKMLEGKAKANPDKIFEKPESENSENQEDSKENTDSQTDNTQEDDEQ